MTKLRSRFKHFIFSFLLIIAVLALYKLPAYCQNIVVVIDPGHGGDALGGNMDDRIERDINMITSFAMKDRLEQYEGVDVYLTRENNTDKEMTRKERFDFAQKVDADFLFSIHYNMSEYHTLYGSEVWVASKGTNYVKGYQFASIAMEAFRDLGLFDRGIKNKLNQKMNGEYYGILMYAEEYNIPAVIIEHCHLDEERDSAYWNEEAYKKFGEADADSVAKYFGLTSTALGVDYSSYQKVDVEVPENRLDMDRTKPLYCNLTLQQEDEEKAVLMIEASDPDTYIQHYQLSYDGGNTFDRLEEWTDRASTEQLIEIPKQDKDIKLVARAQNQYDLYTESEIVSIPPIEPQESVQEITETVDEIVIAEEPESDKSFFSDVSPTFIFIITLISLFLLVNLIFAIVISSRNRKKRRRRRRNR